MGKEFNIFGDIVENDADRWFESDIVPAMFIGWLAKQDGDVSVNINSNGGSVTGGLAIANAIKGYKRGAVTCNVLGIAASMASVIACAGKKLAMGQGAFLMVHNPWTVTSGNAEELRKDADTLDKMRDSIISFYRTKSTKTADELKALMDAETWVSREEADAFGFTVADYAGELKAAASLTRRAFDKAPAAARALLRVAQKPEEKTERAAGTIPTSPAQESAQEESAAQSAETPSATGTPETTATPTPPPQDTPQDTPQEAGEEKAQDCSCAGHCTKTAENWEARYKGLSAKFNDLQKRGAAALAEAEKKSADALAARDAENASLKCQLDKSAKDLADAVAKVSELSARVEEGEKALQKATDDLAQTRDSLKAAEDKARRLENARDLLTAGVLTPASEASYAEQMSAAKTPAEREALRAKKRAGAIK